MLPVALTLVRGEGALRLQLAAQLRASARSGELPAGLRLPGSRPLAAELGVARGVVVDAYAELRSDGTLEARVGSGTRIAPGLRDAAGLGQLSERGGAAPPWWPSAPASLPASPAPLIQFRPGVPSLHALDVRRWRAIWTQVARTPPPAHYGDPAGEPELRAALAAFVNRTRGHALSAEQIVVTGGAAQGAAMIASLLPPGSAVAMEDPGYTYARRVFERAGLTVLSCPVDESGLIVEALPEGEHAVRLVYVTPSHQYPLGVRMSLPRRLSLLAWADRHGALIAEDDYDGEFRYDAPPLPALASLDTAGRVIYLGTMSKVLTPSLRLGYLGAAPALIPALTEARRLADLGSPWAVQHFASLLLLGGDLDSHLRRVRRHYAAQRSRLGELLAPLSPYAVLGGIEAGLHACLHLAAPLSAESVARALLKRGTEVATLNEYADQYGGEALLLGYGGLTRVQLEYGARVIVEEVEEACGVSLVQTDGEIESGS